MMTVLVKGETDFEAETEIAHTFLKRLLGLMFRSGLPPGNALLLEPCTGIHTFFMRFPIDVVYLDRNNTVLKKETVFPWRIGSLVKGTRSVMELNIDAAKRLKVGKKLDISFVEERRV